jgi:hypothetical protein
MDNKIINIIDEVPFVGEDGLDYIRVTKEILTPRKTYLKGTITGKYRGDKIPDENDKSDLFDFEIYEAEVTCTSKEDARKNKPFSFPKDFKNIEGQKKIKGTTFPKEKLPNTLPVVIKSDNKSFGINLLEPQLFEFDIVRKFHQTDGDEVFGTFNAYVTGYVFDYEREEVEEIIIDDGGFPPPPCQSSGVKTGNKETKGGYIQYEYLCKNHSNCKVWGPWEYNKVSPIKSPTLPPKPPWIGCLSEIIGIIGLILGLLFFIAVFPSLIYLVGFYIVVFLLGWLAPYFKWIFRIIGVILLVGFFAALINAFNHRSHSYIPSPVIVDPKENNTNTAPVVSTSKDKIKDEWVIRYRKWQDYDGTIYQGKYKIKLSDINKAHAFKNSLSINQNSINAYDQIVFNLKEFDKNKLDHVYPLFDSISKVNHLNKIKFAEMIVSFVQDIPYAIVLDNGCDASQYSDQFTRNYLLSHQGECDGDQRFGINTPVEFLASLKGDCDSRTLLIYTILSNYNYDVALMSSEFYGHSIIGINLPYDGTAYIYNNQRYVLWETTTPNAKPGEISNQISNLNNWRISLKSK